ncbi:MAG: hypothetical protein IKS48_08260 [Eubacterium sp.]|nr:hypothetical protein [Eubacterium sp.]
MIKRSRFRKLFLLLGLAFLLTGCSNEPPEGYTKEHHTYEDMVEYAKSIDENASVVEEYEDVEEGSREYRIWPATINGISCGVASESKTVYSKGFAGGEFSKTYYRCDTDYDFFIIKYVLDHHSILGIIDDESVSRRFHTNDLVASVVFADEMTEDKLNALWADYKKMNSELAHFQLRKAYWLEIDIVMKKYYFKDTTEEEFQNVHDQMVEDGVLK